ncbi:hypothetical protein NE865_09490 [Phthorimaea operculella]|nr:hypothetical protein NE865_09490 [Phthorimaea operculella]
MNTSQCGSCKQAVGEGPTCAWCGKTYHFHCSGTSERGFNRLGVGRNSWRCVACRDSHGESFDISATGDKLGTPTGKPATARLSEASLQDPKPQGSPSHQGTPAKINSDDTGVLDTILKKLGSIQEQLLSMDGIKSDLSQVKVDIADLKTSLDAKLEIMTVRVQSVESRVDTLEQRLQDLPSMKTKIAALRLELANRDQQLFRKDVELTGLPEQSNENLPHIVATLASKLGVQLDPRDVDDIRRVGVKGGKDGKDERPRPVIITLTRRAIRDTLLTAARSRRGLTTDKIEVACTPRKIFLNEHLIKENRILFSKARAVGKDLRFKFVWTNNGNIFMRRSETSSILKVSSETVLQRLVRNSSGDDGSGFNHNI